MQEFKDLKVAEAGSRQSQATHPSSGSISIQPERWWKIHPAARLINRIAHRLPAWLLKGIKDGPEGHQNGGHGWVFCVPFWLYRCLAQHPIDDDDIRTLLQAGTRGYHRPISDGEIDEAIHNAKAAATDPGNKPEGFEARTPESAN